MLFFATIKMFSIAGRVNGGCGQGLSERTPEMYKHLCCRLCAYLRIDVRKWPCATVIYGLMDINQLLSDKHKQP